jgi:hypothetical protein
MKGIAQNQMIYNAILHFTHVKYIKNSRNHVISHRTSILNLYVLILNLNQNNMSARSNEVRKYTVVFPTENLPGENLYAEEKPSLLAAAKYHLAAAKYQQAGDHEQAAKSAIVALNFYRRACNASK